MRMMSLVASAAFAVAGFVGAADAPKPADVDVQEAPMGTPAHTSGKVTSIHSLEMVGSNDPHILIKLKGDDGETDVVDLGMASELKTNGIEAKEGMELWIDGRVGKINDKPVLVAESICQTKMTKVTRSMKLREESKDNAEARGANPESKEPKDRSAPKTVTADAGMISRTVDGTVVNSRKIKIEGQSDEHQLVKLQTEGGMVVVDLGPIEKMPKIDISEGKLIAVNGIVGKMNDRPIIIAETVGNLTAVEWPAGASAAEQK